jgi:hypothetical protein
VADLRFGRREVMDGSSLTVKRLVLPVSVGIGSSVLRPLLTSVSTNQVTLNVPPFSRRCLLTGTLDRSPQIRT